ncbi:hypothetical protein B0H17DRAFT_1038360 [Mycena rosella]|uniref:HD domain-containing protein n=1 Tax=Mycena rosella TaxID=1033263 RepID=A0AAD7M8I1_MYCRO|nr:hypothetical protein B0H17DRAFT_1038360 [Mycena rosella]
MLSCATEGRFKQIVSTVDPNINDEITRLMAQELQSRYSEPQRAYHTPDHIAYMLNALDLAGDPVHPTIELAIWFHDCVYDPIKGGPWNEKESIRVWEDFADSTQSRAMADLKPSVSALIQATILHQLPDVLPEGLNASQVAVFLDLDMGILGESPEVYAKYAQQIRQEYSHYSAEAYRLGRAKVLESFLLHERIFLGPGKEAMEQQARENIRGEIIGLTV